MTNNLLVLQSDFGLVDGAVSAMIGVALQPFGNHLTHDITPYNTFEASLSVFQTIEYWLGHNLVSVVDPVVSRKKCGCLTKPSIVTPDITFSISKGCSRLFVRFQRLESS